MKAKLIEEGIEDLFKPLSSEEVDSEMEKLTAASLLEKGIKLEDSYLVQSALNKGAKISNEIQLNKIIKITNKKEDELQYFFSDSFKLKFGLNVKGATPDQLFAAAVKNQDNEQIKAALKKGAKNLSFLNSNAMMIAIEKNDVDLVKQLLKHGIDPTKGGRVEMMFPSFDNAPIKRSSQEGKIEILRLLLKTKADPASDSNRALKEAIKYKKIDVIEELLKDERVLNKLKGADLKFVLKKLISWANEGTKGQ